MRVSTLVPAAALLLACGLSEPNPDECQKIDFLFVVDNTASMFDEQQALVSSFPGFIATIEADVNARDYRVMVIDTDAANNPFCTGLCEVLPTCAGQPCAAFPPQTACDGTLGAGLVNDADGLPCGASSDRRFLEAATAEDFSSQFECIARVDGACEGFRPEG